MDRNSRCNDKIALEKGWLDYMMRDDLEWAECFSIHRIYVTQGTLLTLWQNGNKPLTVATAQITGATLNLEQGIKLNLDDVVVGSKPVRLAPHLFAWVPAFSDVRFTPSEHNDPRSRRRMTVPLCIKTLTNPERSRAPGAYYLTKASDLPALIGTFA